MRTLMTITLAFAVGGCSLWTKNQLEGFEEAGCNLELQIREFTPHPRHPIIIRAVRDSDTELLALAVLEPPIDPLMILPGTEPDLDILMPNAFPGTDVRIDFFADVDLSGTVTSIDHTWSIDDPCASPPNLFPHTGVFDVLRPPTITGETFRMRVTGVAESVLFELRVSEIVDTNDPASNRTVGLYRTQTAVGLPATVDVRLEGILRPDHDYLVEIWSDLDGDAAYDPPGNGDVAWAITSAEEFIRDCDEIDEPGCVFEFPVDTGDPTNIQHILVTRP